MGKPSYRSQSPFASSERDWKSHTVKEINCNDNRNRHGSPAKEDRDARDQKKKEDLEEEKEEPWSYLDMAWTTAFSLIVTISLVGNCLVIWIVTGELELPKYRAPAQTEMSKPYD